MALEACVRPFNDYLEIALESTSSTRGIQGPLWRSLKGRGKEYPNPVKSICRMNGLGNASARIATIDEGEEGQRIDNYLFSTLKGVPRSHVYRLVRGGEVRVNSGRVDQTYRLRAGDRVRIPPVRVSDNASKRPAAPSVLAELPILFEDAALLAIDKPAHLAVHGGSGVNFGVIEHLRIMRPQAKFLELVHRLDRDTSGVLLIAKKRSALTALHAAWREGVVKKMYLALVSGAWKKTSEVVAQPLQRYLLPGGERRVRIDAVGQTARTVFRRIEVGPLATLVEADLETGRTHQLRVHLAHLGTPILGDEKYGDFALNKLLAKRGLKRMFLHASRIRLDHPLTGEALELLSPLPDELASFAQRMLKVCDVESL
jgi:23S rRNA pseudouridine955/2504/2580 synthase